MSTEEIITRLDRIEVAIQKTDDLIVGMAALADYLQCSLQTVIKIKKNKIIPYSHLGRSTIWLKSDVIKAIRNNQIK